MARFDHEPKLEYAEASIPHFSHAIALTPPGDPELFVRLFNQGYSYNARFSLSKDFEDVKEAIEWYIKAASLVTGHDHSVANKLNKLGVDCTQQFAREKKLGYIDQAIICFSQAIALVSDDSLSLPLWFNNQGCAYKERFSLVKDIDDIVKAVDWYTQAVALTPDSDKRLPERLNYLGASYMDWYNRDQNLEYIDKAITHFTRAVSLTPVGDSALPLRLKNKKFARKKRLSVSGVAVPANSNDHKVAAGLNDLGVTYLRHFSRENKLEYADRAAACFTRAIALIPKDCSWLPLWSNNQGCVYKQRFSLSKDLGDIAKAIEWFTKAVSLTPHNDKSLPERLNYLGASYIARFDHEQKLEYVEESIAHFARAIALTPPGDPELFVRLCNQGYSHNARFSLSKNFSDVKQAIEWYIKAAALVTGHDCSVANKLNKLGVDCTRQFAREKKLGYIDQAIICFSQAIALVPEGNPSRPLWFYNQGFACKERFSLSQDLDDIAKAINWHTQSVKLTSDDASPMPERLNHLGLSYTSRFDREQKLEYIEEATVHFARAISLTPPGDPELLVRLCNQGYSYNARFSLSKNFEDVKEAIEWYVKAAALITGHDYSVANKLNKLGVDCTQQFAREKKLGYIDQAIICFSQSIALVPKGTSSLPLWLNNQGYAYKERFSVSQSLDDISKAIDWFSQAVALTSDNDRTLGNRLNYLGISYSERFERTGEMNDINQAIIYLQRTFAVADANIADKSLWLANLGKFFRVRYSSCGSRTDIDHAIIHGTRALELAPEGYPQLPFLLNCLARTYRSLFTQTGIYDDIDKAINYQHRAVVIATQAAVPSTDDVTEQYAQLGLLYNTRYLQIGDSDDLGHASKYLSDSISSTPQDHPHLRRRLIWLGECYSVRFFESQASGDMDRAVQQYNRSLELDPQSPFNYSILGSLGELYRRSFAISGNRSEFDQAIFYITRAIDAAPSSDRSELAAIWNCLAITCENSFNFTGDPAEIDKAVEYMNQALKFTNSNDFHWPLRLRNLGLCYWTQFRRAPGRCESLDNAVNYLREAATSAFGSPQLKLSAALEWGRIAAQHSHASDPIPAYQIALSLITEVAWLGNTVEKRYIGLYKVRELAMEAAAVAIDVDKYALALEWLEQARSIVWNQDLQLRSPVDELTSKHPVLAQEFTSISTELLRVGNGVQESHISKTSVSAKEEAAQRHRRLAEAYAALLSRIRKLDGFENFVRPKKLSEFQAVSWRGPVVVINCHKAQCDALVLIPNHTEVIRLVLPMLSDEKARKMRVNIDAALLKSGVRERGFNRQSMAKGKGNHFETTLATLWNNLAKPVLDLLGYTNDTWSGQLPHITWCLTGPLSFLPVHAAGYYDRPGAKLSDSAVSSYAPTIGALLAAKASSSEFISSILAVGQSESPGHDLKPLPGATIELANIQRHVAKLSQHTELVGGKATPMAVLKEMKHHNSVHFACHAHQNVTDPNKSGFFLHEGELVLTSIRKEYFENKGLAFLSACQTATGDKDLPDEAVHLASGMLMAGFPSVVAAMWSVVDDDAPFVVDKFYKELLKDGVMRTDQVARALHHATQALREKVKEDGGSGDRWFSRWVPYIHIGV